MSIRSILISMPKPDHGKSPFFDLAKKYKLKIDFRPFTHVEGVSAKEFREQKINLSEITSVIFTSKFSVDHFFRICNEVRYTIPESMKYFCISETVALYLQRYVSYRKRKIFVGEKTIIDLMPAINKHKKEFFLLPCADKLRDKIPDLLLKNQINFKSSILFKTVISDLSDLKNVYYDLLVFFSPTAIESLFHNFPDFEQNHTRIAAFGLTTKQAVNNKKLRLDIQAPIPHAPSMAQAIELFINR